MQQAGPRSTSHASERSCDTARARHPRRAAGLHLRPLGRITHGNGAFCSVSGYSYPELIGQPHKLIRHPDMPEEAFKDMWSTIGRGRPWTGIVKNRRKNGDHYWVRANVTPILERGKPVGCLSVREAPTRQEIQAAEQLYALLREQQGSGVRRIKLHAGRVRRLRLIDLPARLHRLSITQRQAAGLPGIGLGRVWRVAWFQYDILRRLDDTEAAAKRIASCILVDGIDKVHPHPLIAFRT